MPIKNLFRMQVILIISSFILSACGSGTATGTITLTSTPSPTQPLPTATQTPLPDLIGVSLDEIQGITFRAASAFVGSSATAFNNLLAKFNTVNEWGITVYLDEYESYNTLFTEVSAALDSAELPALVVTLPEQILSWKPSSVIVELGPYLNDPNYGFSQAEIDDFLPIFWQMAGGQENQVLTLPAGISSPFLYYNQTWAQELGFSEAPSSFSQFRQQACAAADSYLADNDPLTDGYGGWVVNTTPASILAWMHAFGGIVVDSGSLLFSSEPNETALRSIKTLYDDHCAWISTERNQYSTFADRSALFITADLAELNNQETIMAVVGNSDDWTVIPFPGDQPGLVAEGPSYSILSTTPEQQLAAWLFIKWALSSENQQTWVGTAGLFPMQASVLDSLEGYRNAHPRWSQAVRFMDDLSTQPLLSNWRQGRLVLGDAVTFLFRTNQETAQIKSILDQMDATIQDLNSP
ncbi:MAG TPA: extracellular solute-binding protein [Anaerolineales bacterium]|nr:extracellular solute-binding protein [Anaerolineales bacterium]